MHLLILSFIVILGCIALIIPEMVAAFIYSIKYRLDRRRFILEFERNQEEYRHGR